MNIKFSVYDDQNHFIMTAPLETLSTVFGLNEMAQVQLIKHTADLKDTWTVEGPFFCWRSIKLRRMPIEIEEGFDDE